MATRIPAMKVRELIERLQTMEQDATVTVRIVVNDKSTWLDDEARIEGVQQHGAGMMATVQLYPEDELKLV